jgi:hypothetical protein
MQLTVPRRLYDRRARCPACKKTLLLNLIYRRDLDVYEIEPFRIDEPLKS